MGERCVGRVDWEGKRGQNLCLIMYRFRILFFRKSPCGGRHKRKERWDTTYFRREVFWNVYGSL